MKITRKQANELWRGLSNLTDAKKQDKSLKLDSETLWKLAVNLRRIKTIQEETENAQQDLIFSLADDNGRIPQGETTREFREKQEALLKGEIEVNLGTFLRKDFRACDNDVPIEALSDLSILIEDFDSLRDEE